MARLRPGDSAEVEVPPGARVERDGAFLAVATGADTALGRRTVVVVRSTEIVSEATAAVSGLLAVGLPLLLAVVAVTTWIVVGRALAPVEAIRAEVDAISAAALHRRVPDPPADDEIGRLARTMNRMLGRLERAQARQRRLVSDASHELRSPIASIRQHAEVALAHPGRTTTTELAATVLAENLRLQRLAEDLLLLTRADEHTLALRKRPVDVDDLVFDEARRLREGTGLRVDTTAVSAGRVDGDAAGLRRVLRNLGENAARHARGHLAFSVAERDGRVLVEVDDDGPGIPEADRERVFERFVRLDDARARDDGGSGLGLAIVAELVAAHGGTVGGRRQPPRRGPGRGHPPPARRPVRLNGASAAFSVRSGGLLHAAGDSTGTEKERRMQPRTRWIAMAGLAVAVAGGIAAAAAGGDTDQELTGATRDRAVAAALAATGGGTVLETEAGDDGAAYGVEVRLADGRQVEVNLDESFKVVGQAADEDKPGEDEGR